MTDVVATNEQIESLKREIERIKGYERLLKTSLIALTARPSIDDIRANITALGLRKEELADWLEKLRSGKIEPVPSAERETVERALAEWRRKAETRKNIFCEMWAIVQDGLSEGQTKKQLWVGTIFISSFRGTS